MNYCKQHWAMVGRSSRPPNIRRRRRKNAPGWNIRGEAENIALMFEEAENIAVVVISSASFAFARNPRTTSPLTRITHSCEKKKNK